MLVFPSENKLLKETQEAKERFVNQSAKSEFSEIITYPFD